MNTIFAWFVFQTALGCAFAVLLYRDGFVAFAEVLLVSQVCVHSISSVCAVVLHGRLRRLQAEASGPARHGSGDHVPEWFARRLRGALPWTLAAALVMSVPAAGFAVVFFSKAIYGTPAFAFAGIAAVSAIFATIITVFLMSQLPPPRTADEGPLSARGPEPRAGRPGLWIREANAYLQIPAASILVLAAHKHVTVIHTSDGDYRVPDGLKRVSGQLAQVCDSEAAGGGDRFMRVHRSFVVNVARVVRFEAIAGGQYRATLGDANETEVPVGRRYAGELRLALGIDSGGAAPV
ncbi:MAG: LytTR family DNA-binding domain-containing protein [Leptospirales bacterium]|jgi:DNA-binding LytR/AlgR family response regulator